MSAPVTVAVLRNLVVVIVSVVLFGLAGFGIAATRPTQYTSEARLLTGQLNVSAQAVPGVVDANNSLASTYSRLVATPRFDTVLEGLSDEDVAEGSVEATPIVNSPILRIIATSPTPEAANALAAASADALTQLVREIDGQSQNADQVLTEYTEASTNLLRVTRDRDRLIAAEGASSDEALAGQANVNAAQLEVDALAARFGELSSDSASVAGLTLVQPAAPAGDSSQRTLQLGIGAGVVAGALIGVAIAAYRERRRFNIKAHSGTDQPEAK